MMMPSQRCCSPEICAAALGPCVSPTTAQEQSRAAQLAMRVEAGERSFGKITEFRAMVHELALITRSRLTKGR